MSSEKASQISYSGSKRGKMYDEEEEDGDDDYKKFSNPRK